MKARFIPICKKIKSSDQPPKTCVLTLNFQFYGTYPFSNLLILSLYFRNMLFTFLGNSSFLHPFVTLDTGRLEPEHFYSIQNRPAWRPYTQVTNYLTSMYIRILSFYYFHSCTLYTHVLNCTSLYFICVCSKCSSEFHRVPYKRYCDWLEWEDKSSCR